MEKSVYKFVFPKISKEYEALASPTSIEHATALTMADHNTDLCMVYKNEVLQFFCTCDDGDYDKPFRYFYEEKCEPHDVYVLFGENAVSIVNDEGFDNLIEQHEEIDFDTTYHTFNTEEEANAYVLGLSDRDEWGDYMIISEDEFNQLP